MAYTRESAFGIFKSYSANDSMHLIALLEQVLRQIAAVLPGNTCYQCFLAHLSAILSNISKVCRAVRSQENSLARRSPLSRKSSRSCGSPSISSNLPAISSTLYGSTRSPASPTTSGRLVKFPVITGVPHLIASRGGKPNPSKNEG